MTTVVSISKVCSVCGTIGEHRSIASSSRFGAPDLDTRPPEMYRSTMKMWVQKCQSCGYCAADISELVSNAADFILERVYRDQLNSPEYPELANSFLSQSLFCESGNDYRPAFWSALHSAWVCDDAKMDEAAIKCRRRALDMLQRCTESGQSLVDEPGVAELMEIDLLRRCGDFDAATDLLDRSMNLEMDSFLKSIIRFEEKLILEADMGCHSVGEVPESKQE